ncbi:hypothetical protein MAR_005107 [Mya arenaria]|uniref:Uncharacterized protein n=1 Tax=Mya arenaria TaxID=6604 RepID=A0ABY7F080_MYAAR|nr:hypothetical protein MAR_005107 [Mya arenaria]
MIFPQVTLSTVLEVAAPPLTTTAAVTAAPAWKSWP